MAIENGKVQYFEVPNHECSILTFRPTFEEFKDMPRYIQYMESKGAHRGGIAKVIPPKEWSSGIHQQNYQNVDNLVIHAPIEQTFQRKGHRVSDGVYESVNIRKKALTVRDFRKMCIHSRYRQPRSENYDDLERKYWRSISYVPPIYGADTNGSLFGEEVNIWNVAKLDTCLDAVKGDNRGIQGVTTPYLYFGMWRATFPWHVEDMDLYSINFIHTGAPKTWYAIAPEDGKRFETFASSLIPSLSSKCPAWMRHKTTLISPSLIRLNGIKVRKIIHEAGEIMITFPYGYHAGFNHGFNVAESTNFATPRWIKFGKEAIRCCCKDDSVNIDMQCFERFDVAAIPGKSFHEEIVPEPNFDEEPVHWREQFKIGLARSEADEQTIDEYIASHKIDRELFYSKYMNSLGGPPNFSSNLEFKIGQKVYVLRNYPRAVLEATVLGRYEDTSLIVSSIEESDEHFEIEATDIMDFDGTEREPEIGEVFTILHFPEPTGKKVQNPHELKVTLTEKMRCQYYYLTTTYDGRQAMFPSTKIWSSIDDIPKNHLPNKHKRPQSVKESSNELPSATKKTK